jgi:membrane-associated phospholipid phosphatase
MWAESPGRERDTGAVTDFSPVDPDPVDSRPEGIRAELSELDVRLYAAVAGAYTPTLDAFFRRLSRTADKSVLWLGIAGVMAAVGGRTGRRAAVNGVASIALASATANLVGKRVTNRSRPDRVGHDVPAERQVPMPTSTSFPSGHSASAFAFAEGVGAAAPALGVPVRLLAVAVSYSRVHTGVHYPGDVVAGALIGVTCGEVACRSLAFARRRWDIP